MAATYLYEEGAPPRPSEHSLERVRLSTSTIPQSALLKSTIIMMSLCKYTDRLSAPGSLKSRFHFMQCFFSCMYCTVFQLHGHTTCPSPFTHTRPLLVSDLEIISVRMQLGQALIFTHTKIHVWNCMQQFKRVIHIQILNTQQSHPIASNAR